MKHRGRSEKTPNQNETNTEDTMKTNLIPNASAAAAEIDPKEATQALDEVRPQLDALDPADLKVPFNALGAVVVVLTAVPGLAKLLPGLVKLGFGADILKEIRTLALALWRADGLTHTAEGGPNLALAAAVKEALELRQWLSSEVSAYARFVKKEVPAVVLARVATSHAALQRNLTAIVELFTSNWEGISGQTRVRDEDLQRATRLCLAIMAEKSPEWTTLSRSKRPELAELRRRAFTLLFLRWEELRAAVAFLRFKEGDAAALMPSLHVQTKARAAVANDAVAPADGVEPSETATAPAAPAPKAGNEVAPKAPIA